MFFREVPPSYADKPIHVAEALAYVTGARLWAASTFKGLNAIQESDSVPLCAAVTDGRARDEDLQAAARIIWHHNAINQAGLSIRYVKSAENKADAISRGCEKTIAVFKSQGYKLVDVSDSICSLSEDVDY